MAKISNILIIVGILFLGFFAYELIAQHKGQNESMQEATERIGEARKDSMNIVEAEEVETLEKETVQEKNDDKSQTEETGEENKSRTEGVVQSETQSQETSRTFQAGDFEAFAILEIPKIGKELAVVEGADANALAKGVGHMEQTAFPGQGEQIVLAGHRDTVFRDFGKLEIGDVFIVQMPYGEFKYQIRETEIVHADDTSVVHPMGEEVLVVSTCYPFNYFASAPERFVAYAYPID